MSNINVNCPDCQAAFDVDKTLMGQPMRCTVCNTIFIAEQHTDTATRTQVVTPDNISEVFDLRTGSWDATGETVDTPAPGSASLSSASLSFDSKTRYKDKSEIARGGMGSIKSSHDTLLHREVAKKTMLSKSGSELHLQRFVEEAQITGQLEHPSIVPVHDLGVDDSGDVYYTMKRVRGRTLEYILTELKNGNPEIKAQYTLAALLDVYVRVCDALSFAHSRGVIHRDLKPENIMIGDFGEVQVMDWGLAKVIGKQHSPDESESSSLDIDSTTQVSSTLEGSGAKTLEGTVLGTPHYMSPEQARGDIHTLGPASDIYALGTLLYLILTLERPIQDKRVQLIIAKIINGDFLAPIALANEKKLNLSHCPDGAVPPSLNAVCEKAMATEVDQRYTTVEDLKKDVVAYQHGFATQAEDASLWRHFLLLVKRHKNESALIAAAMVIIIALTAVFITNLRKSEREAIRAKNEAVAAQAEAEHQAKLAREAQARTEIEKKRSDNVVAFITRMLASADSTRSGSSTMTVIQAVNRMESRITHRFKNDPATASSLHKTMAEIYLGLGLYKKAKAHATSAITIERQQRGNQAPLITLNSTLAEALMRQGNLKEAKPILDKLLIATTPKSGKPTTTYGAILSRLGTWHYSAGNYEEAVAHYQKGIEATKQLHGDNHLNTGVIMNNLGNIHLKRGQYKEAIPLYRNALPCFSKEIPSQRYRYTKTLSNLASCYVNTQQTHEAERLFLEAKSLHEKSVGKQHIDYANVINNLGLLYFMSGDLKKAEPYLIDAMKIRRKTLGEHHIEYGGSLNNLANLHATRKQYTQAKALYEQTLTIYRKQLPAHHPSIKRTESNLNKVKELMSKNSK